MFFKIFGEEIARLHPLVAGLAQGNKTSGVARYGCGKQKLNIRKSQHMQGRSSRWILNFANLFLSLQILTSAHPIHAKTAEPASME